VLYEAPQATYMHIYVYIYIRERERERVMLQLVMKYKIILYFALYLSFFKFKTPIQPLKVFYILKYIWRSNFIFFRNLFLFFEDQKIILIKNHKFNAFSSPRKIEKKN
jgi:hypothetical protein